MLLSIVLVKFANYTSSSAQNFGNYAEYMLVSPNYAAYHQQYATWFLSNIKREQFKGSLQ